MRRVTFNLTLRQHCITYARKTSQFDNISGCRNKLWDKSDPIVLKVYDHVECPHCKAEGHTERSYEMKNGLHTCSNEYEALLSFSY